MTEIAIGKAVEDRYKALGLTQETLAWVAGVSSSTVRNVLASRTGRTWPLVARALGWAHDSHVQLMDGEEPTEIIPLVVLRPLLASALRLREKNDDRADVALKFYERLVRNVEMRELGIDGGDFEARQLIGTHWPMIRSQLSPDEAEPVVEFFRSYGWGDILTGSATIPTGAEFFFAGHKATHAARADFMTDRASPTPDGPTIRVYEQSASTAPTVPVPPEVLGLLDVGELLDYAVVPSPKQGLYFAVLAVRRGNAAMGDSARAAAAISGMKRLVSATELAVEMEELPQFDLDDTSDEAKEFSFTSALTTEVDTSGKWGVVIIDKGKMSKVSRQRFEEPAEAAEAMNKFITAARRLKDSPTDTQDRES